MIALLMNHLWQSSLCAGGAGLIALALRRNSADIRFWLWFAASLKFLVPFSVLAAISAYALMPVVPPLTAPAAALVEPLAKPFSGPAMLKVGAALAASPAPSARHLIQARAMTRIQPAILAPVALPQRSWLPSFRLDLESTLLALWAAGFLMLAFRWLARWLKVRALLADAVEVQTGSPVTVKLSASRLEPGLVGIFDPVILLPRGIDRQLSKAELKAVLAHELCHWRRHDNLLAAIHMLVEALFWFFPLVWWLGARLNAERERACDESVLADGNDPQMYAEGILKVCRAYLQSPLACVAGISGSVLKERIATIMENRLVLQLNAARKLVLSAFAAAALALPLALGLIAAPVTRTEAKPAPLPAGNTQKSAELAPTSPAPTSSAPTSEVSTAASLTSRAAEIPPGGQAVLYKKEAATVVTDATLPPPAIQPPSLPDVSASAIASSASLPAPVQTQADPLKMVAQNNQPAAPGASPSRSCALPMIADTAELKPVAGSDLMTVPVVINGKPKQFLLDIGTNPMEVSQAAVAELGLPETTKMISTIQIGGTGSMSNMGSQSALHIDAPVYDVKGNQVPFPQRTRVRIGSFTLGQATAKSLQFMIATDGEIARSAPYDGLLTNDIFRQYDVEVDFAGKQINFLTPAKCTDPDQVVFWSHFEVAAIPMTIVDGKIQVPVTIEGHQVQATIDTSSERSVMRRDVAELAMGYKAGTPGTMAAGDLRDGQGQPVFAHTFSQISFTGGVTAVNVPVLIQENSMLRDSDRAMILGSRALSADARIPDFTIGMDVLRQLHLYFVFDQKKLYATAAH